MDDASADESVVDFRPGKLEPCDLSRCTKIVFFRLDGQQLLTLVNKISAGVRRVTAVSFRDCTMTEIPPDFFAPFTMLHELNVVFCQNLRLFCPDPASLPNLAMLSMVQCQRVASIWPHAIPQNLASIELDNMLGLSVLPETIGALKRLYSFKISVCDSLTRLPRMLAPSLFCVNSCRLLTRVPEFLALSVNAKITVSMDRFEVTRCKSLAQLPSNAMRVNRVDISGCPLIRELPPTMYVTGSLSCNECSSLERLPSSIEGLLELNAESCTALAELPPGLHLARMNINGCRLLAAMPDISSLSGILDIKGCNAMQSMPERGWGVCRVTGLGLNGMAIALLPAEFCRLPRLKTLTLSNLRALAALPDAIWTIAAMEALYISYCPLLRELPACIAGAGQLVDLTLSDASVTRLPDSVDQLQQLKRLSIHGCKSLTELPATIWQIPMLERFVVSGCCMLDRLPEGVGATSNNLRVLDITDMPQLTRLPSMMRVRRPQKYMQLQLCVTECFTPETVPAMLHLPDAVGYLTRSPSWSKTRPLVEQSIRDGRFARVFLFIAALYYKRVHQMPLITPNIWERMYTEMVHMRK